MRRHPYQTNDGCSQTNERADRNDDQGQFPTLVKSQQEPTDARGHALNENGHLVSNGIIDFINIARNKRGFDHYNGIGQFKCLLRNLSLPLLNAPISVPHRPWET